MQSPRSLTDTMLSYRKNMKKSDLEKLWMRLSQESLTTEERSRPMSSQHGKTQRQDNQRYDDSKRHRGL